MTEGTYQHSHSRPPHTGLKHSFSPPQAFPSPNSIFSSLFFFPVSFSFLFFISYSTSLLFSSCPSVHCHPFLSHFSGLVYLCVSLPASSKSPITCALLSSLLTNANVRFGTRQVCHIQVSGTGREIEGRGRYRFSQRQDSHTCTYTLWHKKDNA